MTTMAHHAAMSLCAAANALCSGSIARRLSGDARMAAFRPLLCERMDEGGAVLRRSRSREELPPRRVRREEPRRGGPGEKGFCLLSNGDLTLSLDEMGEKSAALGGLAISDARLGGTEISLRCGEKRMTLMPSVCTRWEMDAEHCCYEYAAAGLRGALTVSVGGEENGVLAHLTSVVQRLDEAERCLTEISGMSDRVRSSLIDLKDIAQDVGNIMDTLNDDPSELARVDERLSSIYSLMRKHNAQNVNQLIDIQHDYERQLGEIDHNDEMLEQLKSQVEETFKASTAIAADLSANRRQAATKFVKELLSLALPLGMKNLAFDVQLTPVKLSRSGADHVEFMMAFNKNQRLMPVKETASGGEISRVMLCIKTIIARHMQLPSIIFDEVDTGVSGDVANMIGEMMADIARAIQVIAITHLPQVAANGDHHLRVYKTDNERETLTHVEQLSDQEHVMEIARMLSGKDLNQAAIENAKSLIKHKTQ